MSDLISRDEVLKIVDKMFPTCICPEDSVLKECPNELMDGAWTDYYNKELKEKIKKIQSQGKELTPSEEKGKRLSTGSQVSKLSPQPDTNTQNLKGCGRGLRSRGGNRRDYCGKIILCEKCQGKVKSNG